MPVPSPSFVPVNTQRGVPNEAPPVGSPQPWPDPLAGARPTSEPEKPPVPVQLFADSLARLMEETAVPVAVTVTSDPFGGTVISQEYVPAVESPGAAGTGSRTALPYAPSNSSDQCASRAGIRRWARADRWAGRRGAGI